MDFDGAEVLKTPVECLDEDYFKVLSEKSFTEYAGPKIVVFTGKKQFTDLVQATSS